MVGDSLIVLQVAQYKSLPRQPLLDHLMSRILLEVQSIDQTNFYDVLCHQNYLADRQTNLGVGLNVGVSNINGGTFFHLLQFCIFILNGR